MFSREGYKQRLLTKTVYFYSCNFHYVRIYIYKAKIYIYVLKEGFCLE